MVITYKASILQQILNRHKVEPIESVKLTEQEFAEVVEETNTYLPDFKMNTVNDTYLVHDDIIFYNGRY